MASETLTIGQLSTAAGVPTSTIRYYERRGLVLPTARTTANYRTYTGQMVERVRFIRAAMSSGFGLKDVAAMLKLTDAEQAPCNEVYAFYDRRLSEVRERLHELQRVEQALITSRRACCMAGDTDLMQKLKPATKSLLNLHHGATRTLPACSTKRPPPRRPAS